MAIVTISRGFASGGDEVASRLCEVLGCRSFGKDEIIQAAKQSTMSKFNAIDYSEDNHEIQTDLDRLFGRTASPVQKIAWAENPSISTRPERADVQDTAVLSLVKQAMLTAARAGNIVIIGRGGQVLLRDMTGVLHVRIEAPDDIRIERVKQQLRSEADAPKSEDKLARAAAELVLNRDKASADYIQHYYNVNWQDPRLYHLLLNLGKLSMEASVQIIVTAARSLETQSNSPVG